MNGSQHTISECSLSAAKENSKLRIFKIKALPYSTHKMFELFKASDTDIVREQSSSLSSLSAEIVSKRKRQTTSVLLWTAFMVQGGPTAGIAPRDASDFEVQSS